MLSPESLLVTATVNFWAPYENGVGHMSAEFSNGVYISFWPERYPGKLGLLFWDGDSKGLLQDDLAIDIRSEDNRPPTEQFLVRDLDGSAVKTFYNQLRNDPGRWSVSRNCADIVAQALQIGGLRIENTQKGSSTPRDVLNIIKAAAPLARTCPEKVTWQGYSWDKRIPQ
jgi:hypothetical protein